MRTKQYVGISARRREVFHAMSTPTQATHPQYGAVIGPFRTKRGAVFMARNGYNNPHCRTVADAERLSKTVQS